MRAYLEFYNDLRGYCLGDLTVDIAETPRTGESMELSVDSEFDGNWTVSKIRHKIIGCGEQAHEVHIMLVRYL